MNIIIYISLLLITIISGIFAASPYEPKDKPKEATVANTLGFTDKGETKKYLCSKLTSLVVFVLSIASITAMYLIKG